MANDGLVHAMYVQLNTDFLKIEQPGLYSARVTFKGHVYKIYGTRHGWIKFFRNKPVWSGVSVNDR